MYNLLIEHPSSVEETYVEHMKHALYISWCACKISFYAFVHALCPCWFISNAGDDTIELYEYIKKRRGEQDNFEFTL